VQIGLRDLGLAMVLLLGLSRAAESAVPSPDESDSARLRLGQSVFETVWAPAGAHSVAHREGVGPLFNAASCNACHNHGAGGVGPASDGQLPVALEVQLQAAAPEANGEFGGDPVYGHVFNTVALGAVRIEGMATVQYTEIEGHYYPDGTPWHMRAPRYRLGELGYGPLSLHTVIKPRLAPALYGVGLLERVPESAITAPETQTDERTAGTPAWHSVNEARVLGRFGWQGDSLSIRDQSAKAFAREMGLTSPERPRDDCTPAQAACLQQPSGGSPEVSGDLLDALVAFQRTLGVPQSPTPKDSSVSASRLFADIGCTACHRPQLPVELPQANGTATRGVIQPYTDLRLHDLGPEMADEDVSGAKVTSRWRTAPLWGLGYRARADSHPTLLHDGRARSAEEAILWHSGEAAHARHNFVELSPRARALLLEWLASL